MVQARCPICASTSLLEFYEPAGVALCADCGHILRWFCQRFVLERLSLNTNFVEELWADSLDLVELMMELEDEHGLRPPQRLLDGNATVEEVVLWLRRQNFRPPDES